MEKNKVAISLTCKDFPTICRICLNKGNLQPLAELGLLNLFEDITSIKIEPEDKLPENVCIMCINQLENVSAFISLSKSNDSNLRQILNSSIKDSDVKNSVSDCDVDDSSEFLDGWDDDNAKIKNETCENSCSNDNFKDRISVDTNRYRKKFKKSNRHSTKRQVSTCEICGELFSTKSKLNEHQRKNSSCRTRQYKCMNCEKAFYTKFRLTLHMRSHTKETPFECKICFKKFRHSPNLKRHDDIVHKGLKPFKCEVCGKEYSRQATRNEHMYSHSGERPYICIYCGKSFRTYASHFSHIYCHKVHNGEIPKSKMKAKKSTNPDISEVECRICSKSFSSKSAILQHLQLHGEKQFLCTICGKAFIRKRQFEDHCKTHTGEKPYICKYCGKGFRLASGYRSHILIHTGEKPYQCKTCQKSFVQSTHLKKHMRIHTGEKPYSCSFCGKSFAQNCNLKVHRRIHTGETPYHCSVCNMAFYDLSNMKKHKSGHTDVDQN